MSLTIFYSKYSLLGNLVRKHNVTMLSYPHSHTIFSDHIRVIASGFIIGDTKNARSLIRDLKKDDRLVNIEIHGKYLIMDLKQGLVNKELFQPGLLYVGPGMVNSQGEFVLEVASWSKDQLIKIYRTYGEKNVRLNWIRRKNISSVQIATTAPNLTEKQERALRLAVDKGYYGYPRRIDMVHLAKEFGCSSSTFQFHLRNAEKKIMPKIFSI